MRVCGPHHTQTRRAGWCEVGRRIVSGGSSVRFVSERSGGANRRFLVTGRLVCGDGSAIVTDVWKDVLSVCPPFIPPQSVTTGGVVRGEGCDGRLDACPFWCRRLIPKGGQVF